ncbi:MAG: prepilin-type N-terminal cleavage/methylation domain-containing protein [Pyrinomonadaceae bacterium]|nr:prepilin-type N-terminal cleavage/methylation domain-containing protein [Pyrinomonadaceae bacterium]
MKNTNQNGFSLVELLVVVIIIAIVAAIAIPSLLASRRAANEASAISSLRTIHSAQATYFGTTGGNTSYATLAQLGTDGLIDTTLAGGAKSGYGFVMTLVAVSFNGYCAEANPTTPGVTGTGRRVFAGQTSGVIYQSAPDGTSDPQCAAGVLTINGSTPIQ